MATDNDTLLDLSTAIDRKHITINGKQFPLRHITEFSLLERHEIAVAGRLMQGMSRIGEDSDEAVTAIEKASQCLTSTTQRLLIDADDAIAELSDDQKLQVLNCFFGQMGVSPKQMEKLTAKQLKQQRVSKGSTAAKSTTG